MKLLQGEHEDGPAEDEEAEDDGDQSSESEHSTPSRDESAPPPVDLPVNSELLARTEYGELPELGALTTSMQRPGAERIVAFQCVPHDAFLWLS